MNPGAPPQMIDPNTGGPLVDNMGMPTAPPLIVPVNSFDNHQAHIEIHNNYRKGQEFEQLPQNVKDLFEEHVNQHMMALGLMPGMPSPVDGANNVTSGEAGSNPDAEVEAEATGQPPMQGPPTGGM